MRNKDAFVFNYFIFLYILFLFFFVRKKKRKKKQEKPANKPPFCLGHHYDRVTVLGWKNAILTVSI